jgi:hypothetical protein
VREDLSGVSVISDDMLWAKIAPVFSNRAFMRPHSAWYFGLASRAGENRIRELTGSAPARRLKAVLAEADAAQISRLAVRSAINQDQAEAALRLTLVANISAPVGGLVLLNQFLPGSVVDTFLDLSPLVVLMPLLMVVSILLAIIWYAYAGVAAARDLNHLLRIAQAEASDVIPEGPPEEPQSPEIELS